MLFKGFAPACRGILAPSLAAASLPLTFATQTQKDKKAKALGSVFLAFMGTGQLRFPWGASVPANAPSMRYTMGLRSQTPTSFGLRLQTCALWCCAIVTSAMALLLGCDVSSFDDSFSNYQCIFQRMKHHIHVAKAWPGFGIPAPKCRGLARSKCRGLGTQPLRCRSLWSQLL